MSRAFNVSTVVLVSLLLLWCASCEDPGGTMEPLDHLGGGGTDLSDVQDATDQEVFPVGPEMCGDGIDNDGDGWTDDRWIDPDGKAHECCWEVGRDEDCYPSEYPDAAGRGICKWGKRSCSPQFLWSACRDYVLPATEMCNGLDDDCDGQADDGADCGLGATCLSGRCICSSPRTDCNGRCVDTTSNVEHCGECDYSCGTANTIKVSCIGGNCVLDCQLGFTNCDNDPRDGCEFEIDPESCGNGIDDDCNGKTDDFTLGGDNKVRVCCGNVGASEECYPDELESVAGIGECVMGHRSCTEGAYWGDCEGFGEPEDETCDLKDNDCDGKTDEEPMPDSTEEPLCKKGKICFQGGCVCPSGFTECPERCADLTSDPLHCSDCGNACRVPAGAQNVVPVCWDSVCDVACVSGFVDCNGDLASAATDGCEINSNAADYCGDANNDGELDDNCNGVTDEDGCVVANSECVTGCCECKTGYVDCGPGDWCNSATLLCVDLNRNAEHCGVCDHACRGTEPTDEWYPPENFHVMNGVCTAGACVPTTCHEGWKNLNGQAFDGCECEVLPEVCDGLDNDCDGVADDGDLCDYLATGRKCVDGCVCVTPRDTWCEDQNKCVDTVADSANCGFCGNDCLVELPNVAVAGCMASACIVKVCQTGFANCNGDHFDGCEFPVYPEACNGLDDDCNGSTDETFEGKGTACDTALPGVCREGRWACEGGNKTCVALVAPGSRGESCNLLDDDCDGDVDEGLENTGVCDIPTAAGICRIGHWSCLAGERVCQPDFVAHEKDDECNGKDDDCDGLTDEDPDATGCSPYYWDSDADSFGVDGKTSCRCKAMDDYRATKGGDCNDDDAAVYPGKTETCNGKDDDCVGGVDDIPPRSCQDVCGTGQQECVNGLWVPCHGGPAKINCIDYADNCTWKLMCPDKCPSEPRETCNGKDDDCDGTPDDGVLNTYYRDGDGDGYGNSSSGTKQACSTPSGYSTRSDDCNDSNRDIYPGRTEACNGVDDDCDGSTDEGVKTRYYRDSDGDTYGNKSTYQDSCSKPSGYVLDNQDCNDSDPKIKPGATEACNGKDDDCDGSTDEGATICSTGYVCQNGTCKTKCAAGLVQCDACYDCLTDRCSLACRDSCIEADIYSVTTTRIDSIGDDEIEIVAWVSNDSPCDWNFRMEIYDETDSHWMTEDFSLAGNTCWNVTFNTEWKWPSYSDFDGGFRLILYTADWTVLDGYSR